MLRPPRCLASLVHLQLFTRKHPKRKVLGRGGVLSCFGACFAPPAAAAPRPATNLLTGKPFDARTIPPVSRWGQKEGGLQ